MPLVRDQEIDGHSLIEFIGGGKDGEVWLARHTNGSGQQDVAVKFFRNSGPDDIARIKLEFETMARVRHPGIPRVFGNGVQWHDGKPYITMEYAGSKTLKDRIARERCIPVRQALDLASQVAGALDACHSKSIIHRDVKPLNIRISHSGTGSDHAFLVDFGIVKKQDLNLTSADAVVGTPNYMSPEQANGATLNGRSDQYSLAISLWEMLTGRVTFEGRTAMEVMYKHVHEPPGPLRIPGLDSADPLYASIDFALRKALSKDRDARFASCAEFIRAAIGENVVPKVEVCASSGMMPGPHCQEKRMVTGPGPGRACRACKPVRPPRPTLIRTRVCRVSGLLPGKDCKTQLMSFESGSEPTETCDRCVVPPVPALKRIKVCRVSGLLPGKDCKPQLRSFESGTEPTETCDRCVVPPPPSRLATVRICEKTGLKASARCRQTVTKELQKERIPELCRECVTTRTITERPVKGSSVRTEGKRKKPPMATIVLMGGGAFVIIMIVIAGALGGGNKRTNQTPTSQPTMVTCTFDLQPSSATIERRADGSSRWEPTQNGDQIPAGKWQFHISAKGYKSFDVPPANIASSPHFLKVQLESLPPPLSASDYLKMGEWLVVNRDKLRGKPVGKWAVWCFNLAAQDAQAGKQAKQDLNVVRQIEKNSQPMQQADIEWCRKEMGNAKK